MTAVPRRLVGGVVCVKVGGRVGADAAARRRFAADVVRLHSAGVGTVVVHGGGPQVTAMLDRLGVPADFRGGLRVTTAEAVQVVRMVLCGKVGRELVGAVNAAGPLAVGLSGEDGGTIVARRRRTGVDGGPADLGLVGEAAAVDPGLLRALLADGRIPVVATVAPDAAGTPHNLNADSAAAALAVALGAAHLVLLTDVPGLCPGWPADRRALPRVTAGELAGLLSTLDGGMAPKMEACLAAVAAGVPATVADGRRDGALLAALAGEPGAGTRVVAG